MKSFAIWCKHASQTGNGNSKNPPCHELTINLWNIKSKKTFFKKIPNVKKQSPFLDFGLLIKNFRTIEEIILFFPFNFSENEFIDLCDKLRTPETVRLIFNDNSYEVSSISQFHKIHNKTVEMLLFNLKNEKGFKKSISLKDWGTQKYQMLSIKFDEIKTDSAYNAINDIYLRFRICSEQLEKELLCKTKLKNWFLESGFSSTQIVDLKINKDRNIPYSISKEYREYSFMEFEKIHFFIMEPANNDIVFLGDDFIECRNLEIEDDDWNEYLNNLYNTKNTLVYHWKRKKKSSSQTLIEYSKLIKITTATTNWLTIIIYIVIVIVLGAIGSGLEQFIVSNFTK